MKITLKPYVVPVIGVAIVVVTWQGINSSPNYSESEETLNDMSAVRVEAPLQANNSMELEEVEVITMTSELHSGLTQSPQGHFNQYLSSEPNFKSRWTLEQIQALKVQQIAGSDSQVLVAVLDTGIDSHHRDLSGKVLAEVNFTESATTNDLYGHGTHIAGIIAAKGDNSLGITGLAPRSRLLNVKVVNDKGRYQVSKLAEGIIWAVNNGAKVVNISIQLAEPAIELKEAVDYAWNKGAIIIAAAGNDGSEKPVYPASYENCIAVTAIRENGDLAPLANYGDWVDVAAPGCNIYSTLPNNSYGYKHGTSFATAYVSGLAALLFPVSTDTSGNGRLNDEIRRAIEMGYLETGMQHIGE